MLDKQKEMTRVQINLSKAQYIPSLSLFGDFSYNNQQNDFGKLFNGSDQWLGTSLIGLSLNVPIFSGLQRYYRVKQNKIQYNQIALSRDQTKKLIDIEVKNAADKLYNSKSVADAQFANMQLATDVYKVVSKQYNQGMSPLTDLLNAGSALISAQSAYTHALVQLKIAELEVFKSTGYLLQILN
jgi:outer membrane protein TolC